MAFDRNKFVAALNDSANAGVIIQAIVTLGRALGLTVVVEGVECRLDLTESARPPLFSGRGSGRRLRDERERADACRGCVFRPSGEIGD